MPITRFLCPVDFSEGSRAALRAAVELAQPASAEINLLHVFASPKVIGDTLAEVATPDAVARLEQEAHRGLAQLKQEAVALGAKKVETGAVAGTPWDEIVKAAEKRKIDVIVMGTHGRTGIKRALVGSVAENVVRHAPCSVFVIRARG